MRLKIFLTILKHIIACKDENLVSNHMKFRAGVSIRHAGGRGVVCFNMVDNKLKVSYNTYIR